MLIEAVGRLGYYLPWGVGSGVVTAIAYGLLSTLNANTSTAKWVIFQIIGGIGRGCGLQMVRQNPLKSHTTKF